MSERLDEMALEFSCSKVDNCPISGSKDFDETMCKAWCEHFAWNKKSMPSKPEFFSKTQLRMIVETLGDGDIDKIKNSSWSLAEGVVTLAGEYDNIMLPKDLIVALKRLKENTESNNEVFLDWLNTLADIRLGLRTFLRILEKKDQALVYETGE